MKTNRPKLSVVINTKNAAETLSRCIESVKWADEILVADMHSLDETVKIARDLGVNVIELPEYGRVEPEGRNQANQVATGDWLLQLDADEVVPTELAEKIQSLIKNSDQISAYFLPRKNLIFGQWIQHSGWWPDYQPRLFAKGCLKWIGGVHSKPQIKGVTEKIEASQNFAIVHYNYRSISDFIERLNRYTSLSAAENSDRRESQLNRLNQKSNNNLTSQAGSSYTQTFSSELLSRYFYHEGWRDGEIGLLLAYLQSFSQVVQLAKTRELEGKLHREASIFPESEFRQLIHDLKFWLADYHVKHDKSFLSRVYWRARRRFAL